MSKIVSKDRAITLLEISERTFYRLMNSGLLKPVYEGRKVGFYEEEVLQLKRVRNDPVSLNKDLVGMLLAKVQTLENQMSAVMRILNIKFDPLKLTSPEYRNLYLMADHYGREGWPPQAEEQWADVFVRLRLEDFEEISSIVGSEHPWIPFLRLATTMYMACADSAYRGQLAAGRTNVFQVAGIWCTLKGETVKEFDLHIKRSAQPSNKLVKKLGKTRTVAPRPEHPSAQLAPQPNLLT